MSKSYQGAKTVRLPLCCETQQRQWMRWGNQGNAAIIDRDHDHDQDHAGSGNENGAKK